MKVAWFIFYSLVLYAGYSNAQIKTLDFQRPLKESVLPVVEKNKLLNEHDFSKLFTLTDNSIVYGFIGSNYQRIRVKFIRISKKPDSNQIYIIYGKSMVKNTIDEFNGSIKISSIHLLIKNQHGCEDGYKYKGMKGEYSIFGEYTFAENSNEPHSGVFKGIFRSDFFINKAGDVVYDDIEGCADGYTNNQFVGEWVSYKNDIAKTCNWGDYRIPNSGNFDIGAGDFSPDDKYLKYGWQSVRDYSKQIEEAKWWKN